MTTVATMNKQTRSFALAWKRLKAPIEDSQGEQRCLGFAIVNMVYMKQLSTENKIDGVVLHLVEQNQVQEPSHILTICGT